MNVSSLSALSVLQVGAGAGNAVKSATGMLMPGNNKEEKDGRKSDDHQDNKAAKDLDHEMGKDPKRMEKMVSVLGALLRAILTLRAGILRVWEACSEGTSGLCAQTVLLSGNVVKHRGWL